jgi:uncharacterized protein YkwD
MRLRLLILFACLGLACQRPIPQPVPPAPVPVPTPTPVPEPVPPPAPQPDATASRLLDEHNRLRATKNLQPLTLSPKLVAAAQAHADFMARRGRMAHEGIGDGSPWDRIAATGYSMRAAAENVAWNQADVAAVMTAWMNSYGHRANILGGYAEFGGAVAYGRDHDPYWTTVFATPGAAVAGAAPHEPEPMIETESEGGRLIPPVRFGNP